MIETNGTIQSFAFFLQQAPGVGSATLRNALRKIAQEEVDPQSLLSLEDWRLQAKFDIKPEAIAFVRSPNERSLEAWQSLLQKGVRVLVQGFAGYPERLTRILVDTAPPIMYVAGNLGLLEMASVGFCGSRFASQKGIDIARESSGLLATESINVISGYAKGVDIATHSGALEAGGTTTIVLAEGILHFRLKEKELPWLGDDPLSRLLVVSEFPPRVPWKAYNAMTRNRTICGLSDALVVVESGLEGGTFEAGKAALSLSVPLFCVEYPEQLDSAEGNAYFLEHGAIGLRRSLDGKLDLTQLITTISNQVHQNSTKNSQHQFAF